MKHTDIRNNQSGMVAIITTLILMIVISLMVLGFSQVTRRNQRQALDAQLSSQAFYAAESGINLAKKQLALSADYTKNECGVQDTKITNYTVGDNVAITCLLVNPVNNLIFEPVTSSSKVSLIQPKDGGIPDAIVINWESPDEDTVDGCPTRTTLPQVSSWTASCNQPLLRIDLVPVDGSLNQNQLLVRQYTAFLYPTRTATNYDTNWSDASGSPQKRGAIIAAPCNTANPSPEGKVRKCMVRINGLLPPAGVGHNKYAIRIMSLYGNANVEVHAKIGPDQPTLVGAQMLVDSTARANDVLKRVQARISTTNNSVVPDFAVMSNELCKRYGVSGTTTFIDGGTGSGDISEGCKL